VTPARFDPISQLEHGESHIWEVPEELQCLAEPLQGRPVAGSLPACRHSWIFTKTASSWVKDTSAENLGSQLPTPNIHVLVWSAPAVPSQRTKHEVDPRTSLDGRAW